MVGTHGVSLADVSLVGEDKALQAATNIAAVEIMQPVQAPAQQDKTDPALPDKSAKVEPVNSPEKEASKEASAAAPVPGSTERLAQAVWGQNEPTALEKLHTAVWVPGGEENATPAQARGDTSNALTDPLATALQQAKALDIQIAQLQVSERNDPFHENIGMKAQAVTMTGDLEAKREVFATLAAHQEKAVGGMGMDENSEKPSLPPHVIAALEGLPNLGKFKVEDLSPAFGASDTHEVAVAGAAKQNVIEFRAEKQAIAAAQGGPATA